MQKNKDSDLLLIYRVHLIDLDSSGVGAKGEEVILQSRVPYTSDEREGTIGESENFAQV